MKKGYSFQYGWLRSCLVEATPSDKKGVAASVRLLTAAKLLPFQVLNYQ